MLINQYVETRLPAAQCTLYSQVIFLQARSQTSVGGFECRRHEVLSHEGPKIEAQRAEIGGEILGRGKPAPPHQLGSLGSAVISPAGSGAEPRRKRILVHLKLYRTHVVTTNSVFLTLM